MKSVMERRNLLAGLAVLALSLFVLSGTAFAHATHHKKAKPRSEAGPGSSTPETCVVHALPSSFMDQGEFGSASSVADIIEVECEEVYSEKYVRISANELYSRCDKNLYWRTPSDRLPGRAGDRAELLGRTRQRRQRHGDRAGRALVRGRRKPDLRAPGSARRSRR